MWYTPGMRTRVPSFGQTFFLIKSVLLKNSNNNPPLRREVAPRRRCAAPTIMRLLLCLLSAPVATSLRAAPHFRLLQTGVAAGVAMMGTDGAKATIEVDGVMVDVGGMSRIGKEEIMSPKACLLYTSPSPRDS